MTLPEINYNLCVGCESCVDVCNDEIFESYVFDGKIMVEVITDGLCSYCYACESYCEQSAIDFPE